MKKIVKSTLVAIAAVAIVSCVEEKIADQTGISITKVFTAYSDADIPEDITKGMQKAAEDAFFALRLKNYARMDFMMDEDGNYYCLEANTLPGMTSTSLLPQEAAAVGIGFEDLCQKIVDMAL